MIAGPDRGAHHRRRTRARPARVAADLIAQAEHDEDAVSWCVTTDPGAGRGAAGRAGGGPGPGAPGRPSRGRRSSGTGSSCWCPSMREAIEVANRRAPEHLQIVAEGAERVAGSIRHAGAIFLGDDTPEPVGDYLAGPSHVLPDRRHRALRLAARRLRLREADQRHPLHPRPAGGGRRRHHRAGGGGGAVRPRGGGADARSWAGRAGGSGSEIEAPDWISRVVPEPRARRVLPLHLPWPQHHAARDRLRPPRPVARRPRCPACGWCSASPGPSWCSRRSAAGSAARWRCWPTPGTCSPTSARSALSLLTAWIAQRPADDTKTYGYLRWEILAALVNGAALFGIAGWVVVEAVQRIQHPRADPDRALPGGGRRRAWWSTW